jgi:hypothetical protein
MKTVNFIEAVNSGKRFRIYYKNRLDTDNKWESVDSDGYLLDSSGRSSLFTTHYFRSQFELEEESVTITESQFDEIWSAVVGMNTTIRVRDYVKQELGFTNE